MSPNTAQNFADGRQFERDRARLRQLTKRLGAHDARQGTEQRRMQIVTEIYELQARLQRLALSYHVAS